MTTDDALLERALAVAREAAVAAEAVVARWYRTGLAVETKSDESPVTRADREAERAIRDVLEAHFPEHAYFGEELGRAGDSAYLWLIDPIDGTKSFVRDYPLFSTQIALMHGGELVVGVSSAAQFGEVAWCRRGGGAYLTESREAGRGASSGVAAAKPADDAARHQPSPMRTSRRRTIESAAISFGNLKTIAADARRWAGVAGVVRHAWRTRGYGDFYHYHLLARGAIDAVVESDVNILDIAPLVAIVREAGGVFTDLDGGAVTLETTSVLAAATPELHAALRSALS